MTSTTSSAAVLSNLESTAGQLLERHLSTSKEWFPHELVPWSRGEDFVPGEAWDPEESPLPDATRSALFVNLLTEDNLPYYFHTIDRMFGAGDAWGTWARRWTAEEGRHSIVIRDYLTVTRSIDPWELERDRMHQVQAGFHGTTMPDALNGFVYVALQELATRIAHWNTGECLDDPAGREVMARVAKDENLHYLFYRDIVAAAIELHPSRTVEAIEHQVNTFEMPGTGIAGFRSHAMAIAQAGIYDLAIHHEKILVPCIIRQWKVDQLTGLDDAAERSRDRLFHQMERIGRVGAKLRDKREARVPAPA